MSDVLSAYRSERRSDRLHVWARTRSCPFEAVAARAPASGRTLDFGCGHGLFSLMLADAPGRDVVGVDIDLDKLAVARRAAARVGRENVRFEEATTELLATPGWDTICLVDVLYLLGIDRARELLRQTARALAPGGVLLVKEIDVQPRWKYQLARFQEVAATRLLRITEGKGVAFLPPTEIAVEMEGAGLVIEHVPLQRGRLHPHHLVTGRAPSS
jgi:2-polyprenyl-3-methyl-5-hydroxy-6-metoxy-1,4-benzoquinol methylase